MLHKGRKAKEEEKITIGLNFRPPFETMTRIGPAITSEGFDPSDGLPEAPADKRMKREAQKRKRLAGKKDTLPLDRE